MLYSCYRPIPKIIFSGYLFAQHNSIIMTTTAITIADSAIARQVSTLVTETERDLDLLISIRRLLSNFNEHMEESVHKLLGSSLGYLSNSRFFYSLVYNFLSDPETLTLYEMFAPPECDNYTMSAPYSPYIELYIKIVGSAEVYSHLHFLEREALLRVKYNIIQNGENTLSIQVCYVRLTFLERM